MLFPSKRLYLILPPTYGRHLEGQISRDLDRREEKGREKKWDMGDN